MHYVVTTIYIIVGAINFFPVMGALGADRLSVLYGVALTDPDLLLAMRHRAILLGVVGAMILFASIRVRWRPVATLVGLVSMSSYVLLALPISGLGAAMQRVFWIDVGAIFALVSGYLIWRYTAPARRSIL